MTDTKQNSAKGSFADDLPLLTERSVEDSDDDANVSSKISTKIAQKIRKSQLQGYDFDKQLDKRTNSSKFESQKELPNFEPIINHKSIFEGKRAIGYDDLDFEIVRELKTATRFNIKIKKDLEDFKKSVEEVFKSEIELKFNDIQLQIDHIRVKRNEDTQERKQDKAELLSLMNSIDEKIKAIDIKNSNLEDDIDRIEGLVKSSSDNLRTADRPYSRKKRKDSESRANSSVANKEDHMEQIKSLERIDKNRNKSRQVKYIGSAGFRLTTKIAHRKAPSIGVFGYIP